MNERLALCPQCRKEVHFRESGNSRICPNCGFAFNTSAAPPRSYLASEYSPPDGLSLIGVVLRFFLVLGVIIVVAIGVIFVGCAVAFKW